MLERNFEVDAPPERTWERLADVRSWPGWARHIRSVALEPPGPLGPGSRGSLRLTNGIRSTFAVTAWEAGRRWKWTGPFLWMRIDYDHVVGEAPGGRSRVVFAVDGEGLGAGTLGRLFAFVYARNLDRAIPRFVAEVEGRGAAATPPPDAP
jgi:hypothetical protein